MIANQCFSKEWITRKRGEMGSVDPALLEKSIHALALLCALSESVMPFVFKGGTSMILLLKEFHRISIDIDIVTLMPRAEYESLLAEIGRKPPFLGYEEDDRGERGLPHRTHFKFFYNSVISKGGVCGLGLRGTLRDKHAEILTDGISKISSHLVNIRFRLEEAKISASRAALLAALLKIQLKGRSLKKFRWSPEHTSELPSLMLKPPLENLNRIKALIPEAFYNVYTAQELLK